MTNTHSFRPSYAISLPSSRAQLDLSQIHQPNPRVRPGEKFLSYLPHSGFHNQRIALENALILARLLNRTLLVPPVRLGRVAIPYSNFNVLRQLQDANYVAYLCQLSGNAVKANNTAAVQPALLDFPDLPERCTQEGKRGPVTFTYLPWGWITDFDSIRQLQPTIQTLGRAYFWAPSHLGPHSDDVLVIPDTSMYQYRFVDGVAPSPSSNPRSSIKTPYSEDIALASLVDNPAKLIQVGSLFGSHRLELSDPANKAVRKQIRRHMSLKHPLLQKLATDIAMKISGSGFLAAHFRCSDSHFLETAKENSRMIWWKLVHGILGVSVGRTLQLELNSSIAGDSSLPLQFTRYISPSTSPAGLPFDHSTPTVGVGLTKTCNGELHTDPELEHLNTPLFIATDSKDPPTDERLSMFHRTFPCVFFLGDFPQEVKQVAAIRDPISGMEIGDMLVPFLDAMVVARAARVVGTPRSTFSWYVQDILWRVNHGLDIKDRNGG